MQVLGLEDESHSGKVQEDKGIGFIIWVQVRESLINGFFLVSPEPPEGRSPNHRVCPTTGQEISVSQRWLGVRLQVVLQRTEKRTGSEYHRGEVKLSLSI